MKIVFEKELLDDFTSKIKENKERKTFGYFLSKEKHGDPSEFVFFQNDNRKDFNFEEINEYYVDNDTAGFFADPMETYKIEKDIQARNMYVVGAFHCHMRHPAIFANIDQKYHPTKTIWHLIISIRNPDYPRISAYYFDKLKKVHEAEVVISKRVEDSEDEARKEKCRKLIESYMVDISGNTFNMGTDEKEKYNFIGETPVHKVMLDDFGISSIPVTCEMYKLYNEEYCCDDSKKPATNLTWLEAHDFCEWAGYSLPTEAQWEYACKGGKESSFFCENNELREHCWYSDNSKSCLHPVAQLKPNPYQLYDMTGNIWEWCEDDYDEFYYATSKNKNPVCKNDKKLKVCRGGSYYSFEEMVRSNFRWKEPIDYKAGDIGFRLVKDKRTKKQ